MWAHPTRPDLLLSPVLRGGGRCCTSIHLEGVAERGSGIVTARARRFFVHLLTVRKGMRWRGYVEHGPARPSWLCRSCGDPWPCLSTKDDLSATTDRLGKVIYMNLYLADLLDDQPEMTIEAAYDRLIWWARGS